MTDLCNGEKYKGSFFWNSSHALSFFVITLRTSKSMIFFSFKVSSWQAFANLKYPLRQQKSLPFWKHYYQVNEQTYDKCKTINKNKYFDFCNNTFYLFSPSNNSALRHFPLLAIFCLYFLMILFLRTRLEIQHFEFHYFKQECIPVGCVPAARWPYAAVCFLGGCT